MRDREAREDIKFVRSWVFKIYDNLFPHIVDLTKKYVSLEQRIEEIEKGVNHERQTSKI